MDDSERLQALRNLDLLDTPAESSFDRVSRLACKLLEVPVALFSLVDDHRQFFKSAIGLPEPYATERQTPLSHSFCQHVVTSGAVLSVEDARQDALVCNNLAIRDLNVIAYLGYPVRDDEGFVLGSFCAIDGRPREWTAEQVELLGELGALVATEIALRRENRCHEVTRAALEAANEELQTAIASARALAREAEAGARAKAEFLANMSHEIRTPMNAVLGMTELLLASPLAPDARDFVETIRMGGESLLGLVNDILDLSKIEAGKLQLEHAPFNLRSCIENALELSARPAAAKRLELVGSIAAGLPTVFLGDVTRLRQVLVNLVGNGVKFTAAGEVVLSVSGEIEPAPDRDEARPRYRLRFSVRDTGIGIPAERRERLFQPFSQVDASTTRHYGGTGLGLAICRRLIESIGGRIWVESEEGVGSEFIFEIVLEAAPSSARDEPLAGAVILVDDNAAQRGALEQLAAAWGLRATSGATLSEVTDTMRAAHGRTVVVVDAHLDELTPEGIARLGDRGDLPRLPVVLLVSQGDNPARCAGASGARLLAKPVKAVELRRAIMAAFEGRRSDGAASTAEDAALAFDASLAARQPLRVLVAEDNPVNQRVIRLLLERFGFTDAVMVGDGVEALEMLARERFDVLLLDVQMPRMDGLEVARRLRAEDKPGRPWMIALTANAMKGDRDDCLGAGMDDYVAKPLTARVLADALKRAATRRPSERSAG